MLGASVSTTADAVGLIAAYEVFKQEAQAIDPQYQPETVVITSYSIHYTKLYEIRDDPDAVADLFVMGEMMERSKRPVRILKVAQAWNAYREMLLYYGVRSVAEYLSRFGIHYGYFAAQVPKAVSYNFV